MAKLENKKAIKNDTNKLYVFRRYKKQQGAKKVKHPKLIVDATKKDFGYMGLTEQKKKGKNHRNILLETNPKQGDTRPAYLRRGVEYDDKNKFGQIMSNYNLSANDRKKIIEYAEAHKKRQSVQRQSLTPHRPSSKPNITKTKSHVKTKRRGGKK